MCRYRRGVPPSPRLRAGETFHDREESTVAVSDELARGDFDRFDIAGSRRLGSISAVEHVVVDAVSVNSGRIRCESPVLATRA